MITNILKDFETELISVDFHMLNLETFNLKDFEKHIYESVIGLFNRVMTNFLERFCGSKFFREAAYQQCKSSGVKKIKERPFSLKLCTRKQINLN